MVLALCAACSLGGHRPNYQYFVLTSQARTDARRPLAAKERTLAVEQVTIPGYLDREQIVTRTVAHRLVYSRTDRWAEPLDQAFERTLREELAARLVPAGIQVLSRGGVPAYDLTIDVLRFERSGADQIELWARWTLRSDTDVVDSGETRIRLAMNGEDSNAMASSLSEAVARMATELAARVRKVDQLQATVQR